MHNVFVSTHSHNVILALISVHCLYHFVFSQLIQGLLANSLVSVFVLKCLTQQFSFDSGSLDDLCVYMGNGLQCNPTCPTNRS